MFINTSGAIQGNVPAIDIFVVCDMNLDEPKSQSFIFKKNTITSHKNDILIAKIEKTLSNN